MLRNLARLLTSGFSLKEARPIVLEHANVDRFPHPNDPGSTRSSQTRGLADSPAATGL